MPAIAPVSGGSAMVSKDEGSPDCGDRQRLQPGEQHAKKGSGCRQGPAQVVEQLPPSDQGEGGFPGGSVCLAAEAKDPGQQLPIAAGPAMLASCGDLVARREFLDDLDVGGQARAREDPLQEIMAEDGVIRNPAGQRSLENVDIVDSLADIRAFLEEVLVDVRDRERVRVETVRPGERALIQRSLAADRQRGRHARLKNAVALPDKASLRVKVRTVERMRNLADEAPGGTDQQPRVGVQRDNVADASRQPGGAAIDRHERRISSAAKQAIKFVQFAALAFPPDPLLLALVPHASAMEKKEARPVIDRPVVRVQLGDAGGCFVKQGLIVGGVFGGGIAPIGKQREDEVDVGVGEVVDLEPLDLFAHGSDARQHRGHDDDGAQIGRDAVEQFQPGQECRTHLQGEKTIYRRHGHVRSRNETDDRKRQKGPCANAGIRYRQQRQSQNDRRDHGDCAHVARHSHIGAKAAQSGLKRHAAAKVLLEGAPAGGDQIEAGVVIGPRPVVLARDRVARLSGGSNCAVSNVGLAVAGATRQLLDRPAIEIPGREVHRREVASGAHDRVDRADALEEFRPIGHRDQAHAGDDVARRHVQRALALNFIMGNLVRGRAFGCQSVVQPAQRRGRVWDPGRANAARAAPRTPSTRVPAGDWTGLWPRAPGRDRRLRGCGRQVHRPFDLPVAALRSLRPDAGDFRPSVMRSVIVMAHNSPMVRGCEHW